MLSKPIRCAALAAVLSLVGIVSADGTLKSVSVDKSGSGVSVHIKGKDLAQPTKSWAKNGNSLVLEFDGDLDGKQSFLEVKKGGVHSIYVQRRAGQNKVRVYLALDVQKTPSLVKTEDGWDVNFGATTFAKTQPKVSANAIEPTVAPLEPASVVMARMSKPEVQQQKGPAAEPAGPNVTLNFTNTEVVQILKALAMQTGVNIVTAPDVKGTLSVTLDNVSVKDALDMVTSVSGLRYARVGNSYIVATPDKIDGATSFLNPNRRAMMNETRVVPIYSGSGREIRASVLTSMTDASAFGDFQMFLPNEEYKLEKSKESSSAGDKQSTNVEVSKDPSAAPKAAVVGDGDKEQISVKGMKEQYLVLIGPGDRIGEVEDRIRELDREISKAYGFDPSANTRLVRETYILKSDDVKANDLVAAVASTQPNNFLNVDMYATPAGFANQSVVLVGRESEVKKAQALLKDLDQSGYGDDLWTYDVQHSDPRALRESLAAQVKGLRVSLAPASAGNTRIYEEGKAIKDAEQKTQAGVNTNLGAAETTQDSATRLTNAEEYGINGPYKDVEKAAVPMKLIVRGTPEDIDEAKKYLAQIDVPAKQVALELRVMELSKEDAERIGIDWDIFTGSAAVRTINLNQGFDDASNQATVRIGGKGWGANVTATLDQSVDKTHLIARPNLLALDGREGEIFVGDVIRYIESIQSTQNGVTITTNKVPVGVRLSVLPRIGTDGITLDLRPSVSFLRGWTDIPGGGQLPQTSLRTAQSTVAIKDGDTIAIGGLIQDQDVFSESKVPLLGDLPIIGRLFRKTDKSKVRREVVLFLTAKMVGANAGNAADPRVSAQATKPEIDSSPRP